MEVVVGGGGGGGGGAGGEEGVGGRCASLTVWMREQHGQQQELQNDAQAPSLMPYLDATLERPCQAREQKVRRARGKRVAVQYPISTIRARALVRVFSSPIVCYPTWQRTQGVQQ